MFGTTSFASLLLGASPAVWRLIFDASGSPTGAVQVDGQGSGVAATGAGLLNSVRTDGRLVAMFLTSGTSSTSASLTAKAAAAWNAGGTFGLNAQFAGASGAVASSSGQPTGAAVFTGYRMRAYDQDFPANPTSGSAVRIGARQFEWRASSARWHPAGPVP
ncbi:hypothetical protein SAMN05216567_106165 [Variovorax sp. OK605]|jgi:hypothetical protein|uniref:hypothetical protein n=1 Tax=Variovorax sp. OK605 TaxID=1855317 RepID=UPI0008E9CF31|nr:hypothetical protein [Variovorax sp. OK605]SFP44054.1 hypothetical protein SAMN05216567_106165 [Variovorax sp. OK605]